VANYECSARSNYFRVKDDQAFKEWVELVPGWDLIQQKQPHPPGSADTPAKALAQRNDYKYGLMQDESCYPPSGIPTELKVLDSEGETVDWTDMDLVHELSEHLVEGEVAILMEAGAEKLRYISGYALAIHSNGEWLNLSLNDIYKMCEEKWDITPTDVSY
jgi:hypothetical protein